MANYLLPSPIPPQTESFRPPKQGATIQVIGAGLPRTGTNSFCDALSRLLDGPAYHCGVQSWPATDERHAKTWIQIVRLLTKDRRSEEDRKIALELMRAELNGYVATADLPLSQLVVELMELYPNAKVICTYREKDSWAKSMATILKFTKLNTVLGFFFFWIRCLRWMATSNLEMGKLWVLKYDLNLVDYETACVTWEAHMKMLRDVVPADRLHIIPHDGGWEPLCKALQVDVPDEPYPNLLNAQGFEATFTTWIYQGLMLWAVFGGVLAIFAGVVWWVSGSRPEMVHSGM